MGLVERLAERRERVVGELFAQHVRERAQDRPVLARIAGREGGARRHLHPPLGIHMGRGFLRIGCAGQHNVRARRAAVAVGADINNECTRGDIDLVGAEQEQNIERAGRRHLPRGQTALTRHKAEIKRADARGCSVQDAIAVPAVLDRTEIDRRFGRE